MEEELTMKQNGREVRKDEKEERRKTQRGRRMKGKTRKEDIKHGKERDENEEERKRRRGRYIKVRDEEETKRDKRETTRKNEERRKRRTKAKGRNMKNHQEKLTSPLKEPRNPIKLIPRQRR